VLAINDLKRQSELCLELILPLICHGGRSRDDNEVDTATEKQFTRNEPSLDGFAEADVVRNQEIDAWETKSFPKWQ